MKAEIMINVLYSFDLSIGRVYSIKFPKNYIPTTGTIFYFRSHEWKINGVSPFNTTHEDGVWECMVDCIDKCEDLPLGEHLVKIKNRD